jgi:hypothetical protein
VEMAGDQVLVYRVDLVILEASMDNGPELGVDWLRNRWMGVSGSFPVGPIERAVVGQAGHWVRCLTSLSPTHCGGHLTRVRLSQTLLRPSRMSQKAVTGQSCARPSGGSTTVTTKSQLTAKCQWDESQCQRFR